MIESDLLHVLEEMREILAHYKKLVVATIAVIALSKSTSYADALRSFELIQDDIRLRAPKKKAEVSKLRRKLPDRWYSNPLEHEYERSPILFGKWNYSAL
jgi:predicted anti-sigma-YlaC factor YlaD